MILFPIYLRQLTIVWSYFQKVFNLGHERCLVHLYSSNNINQILIRPFTVSSYRVGEGWITPFQQVLDIMLLTYW